MVKRKFPQVNLIAGGGSLYWARGMYEAWVSAVQVDQWDAYLWLNDDLLLHQSAIDVMLSNYDGKRIIVGELVDKSGEIVYGVREKGLFTGNCVLIPRAVYERLGLICGDYSHAWADSDYAMRARRAGISVVSAGIVGVTEGHPNRPSLKNRSLRERLLLLKDPKGWNLHDLWLYRRRNWGYCAAICSCIHLILHVIQGER